MLSMFDPHAFTALLQVVFVDVVLSADNAVVIGMATLGLPAHQRMRAVWLGIGMATALRVVFAVVATSLLQLLGLLLAGGVLLLWVAWKLWRELAGQKHGSAAEGIPAEPKTLKRALWQIMVADVSMSLDNVLAVAGAARDHPWILIFGLVISVLMMGAASTVVARLIERYRWIAYAGLAVIVYISGTMIWHGLNDVRAAM